eukprot:jgi/Chrzof1/1277/Cz10g00080.t1
MPPCRYAAAVKYNSAPSEDQLNSRTAPVSSKARGPDLKTLIKQSKAAQKSAASKEDHHHAHELFINTLKASDCCCVPTGLKHA